MEKKNYKGAIDLLKNNLSYIKGEAKKYPKEDLSGVIKTLKDAIKSLEKEKGGK